MDNFLQNVSTYRPLPLYLLFNIPFSRTYFFIESTHAEPFVRDEFFYTIDNFHDLLIIVLKNLIFKDKSLYICAVLFNITALKYKKMQSYNGKKHRDDLATLTAQICGVTDVYVRMVLKGKRRNERVLKTYMLLREGKTRLVREVEKIIKLGN